MSAILSIFAYSAIPVAGGIIGGLLGEFLTINRRALGVILHFATGVVVGVVGVELLPRTLSMGSPLLVILAFVIGGLFFIFVDSITEIAASIGGGKRTARHAEEAAELTPHGHWVIAIGIGVDLLTDGLMIAVGYALGAGLALLLALGAFVVEVPETLATAAILKEQGVSRKVRLLTLVALLLAIPAGALLGIALLGRPVAWQVFALAFTAGMLATLMIEEMTPQSHICEEGRFATVSFLAGFSLFAFLGVFFG